MTRAGRPTIPNEIKAARGTLRQGRVKKYPVDVSQGVSNVDAFTFSDSISEDFLRLAQSSCPWISRDSDRTLVLITAQLLAERQEIQDLAAREPADMSIRRALREIERSIVSNLSLLGFTPSDRSRLGLTQIRQESKLDELMRRAEERKQNLERPIQTRTP